MGDTASGIDLLADLESRYDDVLRRLDEVDKRVERTLAECLASRQKPPAAEPVAA